jgi:HAD superfamily hydrolase (TIGR01549 family)
MRPVEAVILDLDGVILDTRKQMEHAFTTSFHSFCGQEAPVPFGEFLKLMGMPLPEILSRMGLPAEMTSRYRMLSRQNLHLVEPYEGIGAALDAAACSVPLGLITGKDRERTLELLNRFNLARYFRVIVCGDDPFAGKPDPSGLLWMMSRLEVEADTAVLVGDSPVDMACAHAGRLVALGASWGFSTPAELLAGGADELLEHPIDLERWIRCSCGREPRR